MIRLPSPTATSVRINRLRTVLAWLEDHAHTLPDRWMLMGETELHPSLVWWDHSEPDIDQTVDAADAVARLTEAHGTPERDDHCWQWRITLGVDYQLRLAVYQGSEVAS